MSLPGSPLIQTRQLSGIQRRCLSLTLSRIQQYESFKQLTFWWLGSKLLLYDCVMVKLVFLLFVLEFTPSEITLGRNPRQAAGTMDAYLLVVCGVNLR